MASNQTANLGLSQWEADDEVLRADFNSDNAKIDAAIAEVSAAALGERRVLLLEETVTNCGTKLQIPLTGIDLSQYSRLVFVPRVRTANADPVNFYVNNFTFSHCIAAMNGSGRTEMRSYFIQFPSRSNADSTYNRADIDLSGVPLFCQCSAFVTRVSDDGSSISIVYSDRSYAIDPYASGANLTELDLTCNSNILECHYRLWGVR